MRRLLLLLLLLPRLTLRFEHRVRGGRPACLELGPGRLRHLIRTADAAGCLAVNQDERRHVHTQFLTRLSTRARSAFFVLELVRSLVALKTTVDQKRQCRPDDDAMIHVCLPSANPG